jgi:sec-independent protein translocase protein TatB
VNITGWEFILLIVLAVLILGPERLPEYAGKLGRFVRQAKAMAENAKGQLRQQMGPEFDEINWQQYDPRQYDPRRIVREALLEPSPSTPDADGTSGAGPSRGAEVAAANVAHDPVKPTPYDLDAT